MLTHAFESQRTMSVKIDGLDLALEVRRSNRARRFTLKVSHTERAAILTVPDRGRIEEAGDFLARHFDWLKRQIEKLPEPVPLTDGATIPLRGVSHRLVFVGPVRYMGVVWAEEPDEALAAQLEHHDAAHNGHALAYQPQIFSAPGVSAHQAAPKTAMPKLCVAGGQEHASRRLIDWLKVEARKDIFYRVHHHAANLNIYPKRIIVRDQATRWGSCSSTGNLSFSWRLIFAPSYVLDYVAAHEVAHLREMNHGPRFWRVVRETMPDMQRARGWLKQHGAELHRFNAVTPLP